VTERTHLFEFLTREELILCLCVAMVTKAEETAGSYPLAQYATPGDEGMTSDWTELVLRAVRFLAFDHGMRFRGIVAHSSGSVTAERAVEPSNYLFVALFKAGGFPDFDILLPQVIHRIAPERVPSLPLEPLRALLADIEASIEALTRTMDTDALQALAALRVSMMQQTYAALGEGEGLLEASGDDRRVH
jgi:hypothetical protein